MINNYDNQDFTGQDLSDRTDMDGLTITGSCFSHEKPDSQCLPANLTGATFVHCNLDNIFIPVGNTAFECSARRFMAMEDGQDWEVDANNNPIKLLGT